MPTTSNRQAKKESRRLMAEILHNSSKKSRGKRTTIWSETNGHCVYCNQSITHDLRTLDHILPKSKGGTKANCNLIPACKSCNNSRGTRFPPSSLTHPEWFAYVQYKETAIGIPNKCTP